MKNASKILSLICLSTSLASLAIADEATPTVSKSGAFVGVEAGYNMQFAQTATIDATTNQTTTTSKDTTFPFAAFGLKAGYGYFFNKYIGLRAYGSYHYGASTVIGTTIEPGSGGGGGSGGGANTTTETKSTTTNSLHQVAVNVEAVYDFVTLDNFSSGVYAGIGLGYGSYTNASTADNTTTSINMGSGFVLPVNVGLEFGFAKHHRASLNFRIPTIAAATKTNAGDMEYRSRQLIMTLGYAFVF
ncbi:hypothetical protein BKN38_00685 [Helicobacter sp. CLO-3]|uniref:outer membrane beta-barrel protein n=1 Tax=unclassified Helicobacter TaxID=2593540 RepID=UPI0008058D49|nr:MULTISPECIES: outer membrane beta-barrel protein [unclassified Helicobacter]OBV30109.1 hypothetical protein BA723_02800 [Helicobacter sp. CLO-3]OHU85576.1 hypothetical protein BKN38_00685 [Helicobacter sp. CLO-3]